MKIGFIARKSSDGWGGDLGVVYTLMRGLQQLGHTTLCAPSVLELQTADFLVLTNSGVDQRMHTEFLSLIGKPYGILGFHEDILHYYTPATGFQHYVQNCLGHGFASDNGLDFSLEQLLTMPHIVHYYGEMPKRSALYNYELMANASFCMANSPSEATYMRRDCPACKTVVVPIAPGIVQNYRGTPDDSFLKWTGLSSKSYVLQVGRLECRKNQLGTLLAMRNFDIPLVFIATRAFKIDYEALCVETALRFRGAPTLFISQNLKPFESEYVKVIPMPEGDKLPKEMLLSAYYHAGLHLHPAFHELPGTTYLEAAKLGAPTIGSSWCTITDYFFDEHSGHANLDGRIVYAIPHHIREIEQLTAQMFGKKFAPLDNHPTLLYSDIDSARDFAIYVANALA
jgi:hypothetical protein